MYLVYDSEEKLIMVTNNYDEAKETYEERKELWKDLVSDNGEFYGDERVILAEIKADFFSYETDNKAPDGNYYWDWEEKTN
jgi:hypothetical protein